MGLTSRRSCDGRATVKVSLIEPPVKRRPPILALRGAHRESRCELGRAASAHRPWDTRWVGDSGRLVRLETARYHSTTKAAQRCRVTTSEDVPCRARHAIIIRGSSVRVRPPLFVGQYD